MNTQQAIKVLRCAHHLIAQKHEHRVCFAIDIAGRSLKAAGTAFLLGRWVSHSLGRETYYEDWLVEHHPEFAAAHNVTSFHHTDTLRPGRLAWIDWMIGQLETNGKLP